MNRFNKIVHLPYKLYTIDWGGIFIRRIARFCASFLTRLIRWYYHCDIPYSLDVRGCYFCHKGFGVVINPRTILGNSVVIQHGVTIGEIGETTPIIGNHVYIGAKATIIGGVKIGDYAKIGASALVLSDVPSGCTAVGVPAKVTRRTDGEKKTSKVNTDGY